MSNSHQLYGAKAEIFPLAFDPSGTYKQNKTKIKTKQIKKHSD